MERDPRGFDVARFGTWTTPGYTVPKVIENYRMRFSVAYPNEERPAARPFKTSPMYDIFTGMNAVWGQQYGLEVATYFALPGEPTYETPTFKRSNAWEATRQEVMAVSMNSCSERQDTVKSPTILPEPASMGLSAMRPGWGIVPAMMRSSQARAFGPVTRYLPKFDSSLMPTPVRTASTSCLVASQALERLKVGSS